LEFFEALLNLRIVNLELNGDVSYTLVLSLKRIRSGGEVNENAPWKIALLFTSGVPSELLM